MIFQGEIETDVDWDEDLNDENSDAYKEAEAQLEDDLKSIIEDDPDIEAVEMTECDFEPADPASEGRRRRQGTEYDF